MPTHRKLTAYSAYELAQIKTTKQMPDGVLATQEQLREVREMLKEINYSAFFQRLVRLTKKEYRGQLSASEAKLFEDMQERHLKPYWRMRHYFKTHA